MIPDRLFNDILRANEAYAEGFQSAGMDVRAAKRLAVLTCIDTRLDPMAFLGLKPGDAKILRNAGARVTDDVSRTLILATYLLGVERLMIIAHTRCRLVSENDDAIRSLIREAGGPDTSGIRFLSAPDLETAVACDVETVRSHPHLGSLRAGGFIYDVDTGRLRRVC